MKPISLASAVALTALLVTPAVNADVPASAPVPAPEILVLSNRADLISGGDALVEIKWPHGSNMKLAKIELNGRPLTGVFAQRANGKYMGLVTGLVEGPNTLAAYVPGRASRITITNHPSGGPVFAGPHLEPWVCARMVATTVPVSIPGTSLSATATTRVSGLASDPLDEACNAQARYSYYYQPKSLEGSSCTFANPTLSTSCFRPFPSLNNPSSRPPDEEIADFTNDRGQKAKAIIRVERGALNRAIYDVVTFFDPARASAPWDPQPGWNQKILWSNGGSAGYSRFQSPPASSVFASEVLMNAAMRRGYMHVVSSFTDHSIQGNLTIGAEFIVMLKERIAETYGPVRFTVGSGCSGGSETQSAIASAYPGVFDGIQPACEFQDSLTPEAEVYECSLLTNIFYNATTGAGRHLTTAQRTAINGNLPGFCNSYPVFLNAVGNPSTAGNCGNGFPAGLVYSKTSSPPRPEGLRCNEMENNKLQVGTFVDADGVAKAHRAMDNVGVQYGLKALRDGAIGVEDFVNLNVNIGGWDHDFVWSTKRMELSPAGAKAIYDAALIADGRQWAKTPIIRLRGNNNLNGDIHENWRAWGSRARLDQDLGNHDNEVIWAFNGSGSSGPNGNIAVRGLTVMDEWLTNIEADSSSASREQKVVNNKPPLAKDMCITTNGVTDTEFVDVGLGTPACPVQYPSHPVPRVVAGDSIARSIVKCQLKPLNFADPEYGGAVFDAGQQARMIATFPQGVCDWTKPGVGQSPARPWLTFMGGPGGQPLGPAPVSVRIQP